MDDEKSTEDHGKADKAPSLRSQSPSRRLLMRLAFWQTIAALAGIVIAVLALYAALTESSAIRRQTAASVWPYVQLATHDYDTGDRAGFEVIFTNAGVGPALMGQMQLTIDGKSVRDWREAVARVGGSVGSPVARNYLDNRVLRPGESVTLISTSDPALARDFQASLASSKIAIIYCYCSIFGDCWTLDSRRDIHAPQVVSKCPDFGRNAYQN